MARSPLFGRRIHITGSVPKELQDAPTAEVESTRQLIAELVAALVAKGANFVVPIDRENVRAVDGMPICFDWLVWQTLRDNLDRRPEGAPGPLAIAVQHHKTEEQIPPEFQPLWDAMQKL